jgi:predicted lipid-binding transport protein (Tim44 family)
MMKKILTTLLLSAVLATTFIGTEAFAKRMGSGSDSGMQRSVTPASKTPSSPAAGNSAAAPAAASATTTAAGAAGKSSMMGPLMGLAAGGLLAAAFMGGAFDGISPMDIVLMLLIGVGIFIFLRRRAKTATTAPHAIPQPATAMPTNQYRTQDTPSASGASDIKIGSRVGSFMSESSTAQSTNAPSWFNEQTFTTQAKNWFVQLQAAWDKKDYAMLGSIVTPELLAELRSQREQQTDNNTTKVDEVFAQVVEWTQDAGQWVLTVRFNGYLSEKEGDFPHAFSEYWHLVRIGSEQGEWKLAGIQQDR